MDLPESPVDWRPPPSVEIPPQVEATKRAQVQAVQQSVTRNPKDIAAQAEDRAPLDLLEMVADELIARVLKTGAMKYGRRNFVRSPINASTYGAAIRRHVGAWLEGEDDAPDTGLSHLAHVGACVHVVLAAMKAGTFVDDRVPTAEKDDNAA